MAKNELLFFAVLLSPVLDGFEWLLSSHDTVLAVIKSRRHQLNPTRNYWERRESNPGQLGPEASVLTVVLCRPPLESHLGGNWILKKGAQAGGRTWDLLVFVYFLSLKQRLRPLGYCAPPTSQCFLIVSTVEYCVLFNHSIHFKLSIR